MTFPKLALWSFIPVLIICAINCSSDEPTDTWRRIGGTDAPIRAMQEYQGRLIFGGEFTRVDAFGTEEQVNHLAAYADPLQRNTHTDVWQDIAQVTDTAGTWYDMNPEPNGDVFAMTIFRGDLIIAGGFSYIGPIRASGIARWDGQTWHSLGNDDQNWGIDGLVYALANDGDNILYAGGTFMEAGAQPATRIAQWNGTTWQPLGPGLNNTVRALHARANQLFAGGTFTAAGSLPTNHIARWTGTTWHPLDVGVDGTVRALTTYRGSLIAGGDFVVVNGFEMNHVARWIGTAWVELGEGVPEVDQVQSLFVLNDRLYASGATDQETLEDFPTSSVIQWNGTEWARIQSLEVSDDVLTTRYLSGLMSVTTDFLGSDLVRGNP